MVSVIMSTYREPLQYVKEAISSVLDQTYRDIELVVMVDDPTNRDLIEYVKAKAEADSRIIFSINEKNVGLTESLNRAKKIARGSYIARMDADDICEPDRIGCQLEYLIQNNYDLVGCNVIDIGENGEIRNEIGTNYPTCDRTIKEYLGSDSAIPHPTWLLKRSIYEQYDYVDFPACEDYEFLTRIALDGWRLGNVKEPKLRYRINRNGISASKKVIQKTSFYYVRRNYRRKKKSDIKAFYVFLESKEGKSKKKGLEKYYRKSERLKAYKQDNRNLKFLISGSIVLLFDSEGRNVVMNALRARALVWKYGDRY